MEGSDTENDLLPNYKEIVIEPKEKNTEYATSENANIKKEKSTNGHSEDTLGNGAFKKRVRFISISLLGYLCVVLLYW